MSSARFRQLPELNLSVDDYDVPIGLGPADLRHGILSNGIRYYVRPCKKPQVRAALALVVRVGSVVETESELGVAHILEHLAFNGTEAYTNHDIVRFLESIGAAFGPCQNARTSADETVYELLVPTDDWQLVENAVRVFAQFAFKIRCVDSDLSRERGAVLEEWRMSKDSTGRAAEAHWKLLLQGSKYAERLPIGSEKIIRRVPASTVKAFYQRWYRPQNMAVVAVGDFDTEKMEALLHREIGCHSDSSQDPLQPIPRFDLALHDQPRCAVFMDSETQHSQVYVSFKQPRAPLNTPNTFKQQLTHDLFAAIMNSRLFKLSRRPSPPFYSAELGEEQICASVKVYVCSAHTPDQEALPALEAVLRELARARLHGFSQREMNIAVAQMMADVETIYLEREQHDAQDLREEYVRNFLYEEFVVDPEYEVRLYKTLLPQISLDEVQRMASHYTSSSGCVIKTVAHTRTHSEAALRAVVDAVVAAETAGDIPPWEVEDDTPDKILQTQPEPGSITSTSHLPVLDVTSCTLSNGMNVYYKRTDFLEDQVLLTGFAAGGLSEVSQEDFSSARVSTTIAGELGWFGIKPHHLPDLLAGKKVDVKAVEGPYWRSFGGDNSPHDLEAACQLIHALFTHSVTPVEGELETCMRIAREAVMSHTRDPVQILADRISQINYGSHFYFQPPTLDDLDRVDPQAAASHFNTAFANPAEFTLCITGNFQEEELRSLLEQYIASIPPPPPPLPPRDPTTLTQLPVHFPEHVVEEDVTVAMIMPMTTAQITLPLTIPVKGGREEVVWLSYSCRLLETKLMQLLRFEFGEVYSVTVGMFFGLAGPASKDVLNGEVNIAFTCDPRNTHHLCNMALDEIQRLQDTTVSEEDVKTVVTLEQRAFELQQHENSHWHDLMVGGLQSKSYQTVQDLDKVYSLRLEARQKVQSLVTPQALQQAMRRLFPYPCRRRYTRITLMPRFPVWYRLLCELSEPSTTTCVVAAACAAAAAFALVRWWRHK